MLTPKMSEELNKQINAEFYSAYLYLSMVSYFETKNLKGFANWMKCQTQEEIMHAMKIYDYVNERGGQVILKQIEGPKTEWSAPLAAFEDAYKHELKVTGLINNLVEISTSEKDNATNAFLQWFVTEQVEEESSVDDVVQKLKLIGNDGAGLFMVDRELATRTFTMPPTTNKGE